MNNQQPNSQDPKCIRCGRRKSVVQVSDLLHCNHCNIDFDDDPDEGGDYGRYPSQRMDREERYIEQRRKRLGGRR